MNIVPISLVIMVCRIAPILLLISETLFAFRSTNGNMKPLLSDIFFILTFTKYFFS